MTIDGLKVFLRKNSDFFSVALTYNLLHLSYLQLLPEANLPSLVLFISFFVAIVLVSLPYLIPSIQDFRHTLYTFFTISLAAFFVYLKFVHDFTGYMVCGYAVFVYIAVLQMRHINDAMLFWLSCCSFSVLGLSVSALPLPTVVVLIAWYLFLFGVGFWVINSYFKKIKETETLQEKAAYFEHEYQFLMKMVPVMIVYKSKENTVLRVSHAHAQTMGYNDPDFFKNMNIYDQFPHEDALKFHQQDLEIINSQQPNLNNTEHLVNPDVVNSDRIWIRSDKYPYYDRHGNVQGVIIFGLNITQQINALREKELSKEEFVQIFNEAPYGIVILNLFGEIVQVNRAFCELLLYKSQELEGEKFNQFIAEPEPYFDKILQAPHEKQEKQIHRKNGTTIETSISVTIISDLDQKPQYALCIVQDISEIKNAERQLKGYSQALEISNQDLEQFAYSVSHDLKEPLRMVSSYIQLLAKRHKDQLNESALEYINYAIAGAQRMNALIDDLLQYSRIGRTEFNQELVEFDTIFLRVLNNLRIQINESKTDFVVRVELPPIYVQRTLFAQLFQNLIGNAIKYSRPNVPPLLEISAEPYNEDFWLFSIKDNGIGIEERHLEKIFQVFQRVSKSTEHQGSGIGLAICKRIVQLHRGEIWATSTVGEGSTFYFTIARSDA